MERNNKKVLCKFHDRATEIRSNQGRCLKMKLFDQSIVLEQVGMYIVYWYVSIVALT